MKSVTVATDAFDGLGKSRESFRVGLMKPDCILNILLDVLGIAMFLHSSWWGYEPFPSFYELQIMSRSVLYRLLFFFSSFSSFLIGAQISAQRTAHFSSPDLKSPPSVSPFSEDSGCVSLRKSSYRLLATL